VFFEDCGQQPMEAVYNVRIRHCNNVIQFTVLVSESPGISPTPPPEIHVTEEVD
jgi:hypothetical protein